MDEIKTLSCRSFAKLWEVEAEYEVVSRHAVDIFEPLAIDVGPKARPYFGHGNVDIYDETGNRRVGFHIQHHDLSGIGDTLVCLRGRDVWYEVTGGQLVYRKDRWHIKWHGYSNTRRAAMMNAGFSAWMSHDEQRAVCKRVGDSSGFTEGI